MKCEFFQNSIPQPLPKGFLSTKPADVKGTGLPPRLQFLFLFPQKNIYNSLSPSDALLTQFRKHAPAIVAALMAGYSEVLFMCRPLRRT